MNEPKKPTLPKTAPDPTPEEMHPLDKPDERKEGGPDLGKSDKQHENKRKSDEDAAEVEAP